MAETLEAAKMEKLGEKLAPPAEAHISTILNGMGNGMMIGSIPFVASKLYSDFVGKESTPAMKKFNVFATVAGCIIGVVFGHREARTMREYREEMSGEMTKLRADIDANSTLVNGWKAQIDAQREKAGKASPATDSVSR